MTYTLRTGGDGGRVCYISLNQCHRNPHAELQVPLWYIAYRPATGSLIVAHEGTTLASKSSVAITSEVFLTDLQNDVGAFSEPFVAKQLYPGLKGTAFMRECARLVIADVPRRQFIRAFFAHTPEPHISYFNK